MPGTFTIRARWILPIDRPPIHGGWIGVRDGVITSIGAGPAPAGSRDLGDAVVMPALANAHTHLELSWMAGRVPPAPSMDVWIRTLLDLRRGTPPSSEFERQAAIDAAAAMRATGTSLVGDVSNTLGVVDVLASAGLDGVVFHELLGFRDAHPAATLREATARADASARAARERGAALRVVLAAHAPYSVSPALMRDIAARRTDGPLTIHLGESAEEIEFLRTGEGAMRRLLQDLGAWSDEWQCPRCDPAEYVQRLGYLQRGMLAVHAVHLRDDALGRLRAAGAVVVTCPRSNIRVGAGMPRVSHFYASGVPVAIGTDSLASVETLNLFDELAELRRIAPDVSAACLLESATRVGAAALGFGATHGTITTGKRAALVAVDVPAAVSDVEEYLVGGVPPSAIRRLDD
jgi:cytosine/adenosine deaminase-related metal-dependent hydrolase